LLSKARTKASWPLEARMQNHDSQPAAVEGAPRAQHSDAQPGEWRTLLAWLAPARVALAGSLAVLAAAKLAAVAAPVLYKYAVDALLAPPAPLAQIAMPGERMLALGALVLVCAYAAARFMRAGFERLQEILYVRVNRKIVRHWARDVMPHIFHLPTGFRTDHLPNMDRVDAVKRTVQRAIAAMELLLRALMVHAAPFILELALLAGALWLVLDWRYALLLAGASALYLAAAAGLAAAESHPPRHEKHVRDAERRLEDGLANFAVVQQFGAEQRETEVWHRGRSLAMPKGGSARQFALAVMRAALWHIGLLACLAWTVRDVSQGLVSLGGLVMVHACWMQLMLPLAGCRLDWRVMRRARADLDAMRALLRTIPRVVEMPRAPALIVRAGEVVFDKVSFGYKGNAPFLRDISFTVARGQKLAIVGPSGSGKSTMRRLLFRFHDVQGGRITIDGQDVREVSRASLRAAIGIIRNRTFLFRASIYENIAWARPGASKEEVIAAAKMVAWHKDILALPNGYESILDNRRRLNQIHHRRIDMARIALRNPPILILEEAPLSGATPGERKVNSALRALYAGRTVIVITHWLSAITDADHIIFLKHGKIMEQGNHDNLLARGGEYAQQWHARMKRADAIRQHRETQLR